MDASRTWSRGKIALVFGGSLLLLAVVFQLLETIVPRGRSAPVVEPDGSVVEPTRSRPRLERVDDRTILIDAGMFHQSRFRFDASEGIEQVDAMYECLERGFEEEFDEDGLAKEAMRLRARRIQERCFDETIRDSIPEPPERP